MVDLRLLDLGSNRLEHVEKEVNQLKMLDHKHKLCIVGYALHVVAWGDFPYDGMDDWIK